MNINSNHLISHLNKTRIIFLFVQIEMTLPVDYFIRALPHVNLDDLVTFLNSPDLGGRLSQIIGKASPQTRFVLVDGLNVVNTIPFLRSIIDNRNQFQLFQQMYRRCFQQLPRGDFGDFLDGQIQALPRRVKINLIRCLTLTLMPHLYHDLHLLVITGNEDGRNQVIPITSNLTWIDISGRRVEGSLEVDDLLVAFLLYYLAIQQQRPVLIWSRDQYAFMETIAPEWAAIRQSSNGILFEPTDSPTGKWDFVRARGDKLVDVYTSH
jgi:hypothetical protein